MSTAFDELVRVMARLRAPGGCPWDRKQTHDSLKPYLIEEVYEVLDALDQSDPRRLREELGDLLLQIIFHSQLASEGGRFTITDVLGDLTDKLIRRHPHVFGSPAQQQDTLNADDVTVRWEDIKKAEREREGRSHSVLDGVPKTLPALLRAFQVQARVSRVGFDWERLAPVVDKLEEELREFKEVLPSEPERQGMDAPRKAELEAELGDLLFTIVNVARFLKLNPEEALRKTVNRFTDRFHYIEREVAASGRTLESMSPADLDQLWNEAKVRLTPGPVGRQAEPDHTESE